MDPTKAEVNGVSATVENYCTFLISSFDPNKTIVEWRAIYPDERGEPDGPKAIKVRGTLVGKVEKLSRLNERGYGIFLTVNETDGEGVKSENVTGIRALWADWDDGEAAEVPVEPSLVVRTSPNRMQAYWLLDDEMTKDEFKSCMSRIVTSYGGDDRCKDAARVLRVPGFNHTKGEPWRVRFAGKLPKEVTLYTAKALCKAFPPVEKAKASTAASTARKEVSKKLSLSAFTFDAALAQRALDCLPTEVADDYEGAGIKVCAALKRGSGGSQEGYDLWHGFAARSPRYTKKWADEKWNSYDENDESEEKIHIGTLYHMAAPHGFILSATERLSNLAETIVEDDKQTASEFGLEIDNWTDDATAEFFSRMNREHALVSLGSSVRYLHERDEHNGERGVHFLPPDSMKRLYANILVPVNERKLNGFDAWDRWKGRRQCRGVGLFPGSMNTPSGYVNLWRGFAVEPRKGRWNLFNDHLLNVVCSGSEEYYFWLIDWLAHIFQHPEEKPGTAVVLKSEAKGTGKSMVYQLLRRILGVHAMSVAQASHVVGNFNGHLLPNILLGVEEAFWAGNKAAEGVIKNLITEPTITIEQKGIDPISAPNFTRLLINSNESWTVPVGIDERRFFVLEVNNPRAKENSYFDPIFKQMKEEGGLEAMLYSMLEWDIKSDLRNPPETKALQQEREFSLDGVHKWVCEVARSGCVYDKAHSNEIELSEEDATALDRVVVQEAAREYCGPYEGRSLHTRLGLLLKRIGVESEQVQERLRRKRVYVFPPLHVLRSTVEKVVRVSAVDEVA